MTILPLHDRVASAQAVFNGPRGAVSRLARERATSRQMLYRQAQAVAHALDPQRDRRRLRRLQRRLRQAQRCCTRLRRQRRHAVVFTADRIARFAATAQAEGVSLPVAQRLLAVALGARTPSVASLGRCSRRLARHASAVVATLDAQTRPLIRQVAADEIFVGRQPILMVVEPESLGWQCGRLVPQRDGATWQKERETLPALEHLVRDGGTGLARGVALVNAARQEAHQAPITDQADHFHLLREGTRVVRRLQGQAGRALEAADQAERRLARVTRQGRKRTGAASIAARRWRAAAATFDRWTAAERSWARVRAGLALFTPEGTLPTRPVAEATLAASVKELSGPEWSKVRRQLGQPAVLAFLDRAAAQVAAVPAAADVKALLVHAEGLRQRPAARQGDHPVAASRRGVLLAAAVLLSTGGEALQQAARGIRGALRQAWRASSLVEGLNSVLRMQQARHRRVTQELLDLKRLYWNTRVFRTGRRKGQTPYGLLGLNLPGATWWDLLNLPPEQLQEKLSGIQMAA